VAAEQLACTAKPGDHLVDDQQRADLIRHPSKLLEVAVGRDQVPVRPWIGSTIIAATLLVVSTFDLLFNKLDAGPLALGKRMVERTAAAICVRSIVNPRRQRAELVLEVVSDQSHDSKRFPVKSPQNPITSVFFVKDFARRRAASTASAPPL